MSTIPTQYSEDDKVAFINRCTYNIDAARLLETKFPNAGANRTYYSAYSIGCVVLMERGDPKVNSKGGKSFTHTQAQNAIIGICSFSRDIRKAMNYLEDKRVKADYFPDDVTPGEMQKCIEYADKVKTEVMKHV